MNVGEMCVREVVVVEPSESLATAAKLMAQEQVGCVVVVEGSAAARTPTGIVTDRDIALRGVAQQPERIAKLHVQDVMSSSPLTVQADEDLYDVLKQMRSRGVHRVPVVDDRGVLAGVLSYDDIVEWVSEELWDLTRVLARGRDYEREVATGRR